MTDKTFSAAVEVCLDCDIADCKHIRARRAAPSPGMPSEERAAFEAWVLECLQGSSYLLHRRDMLGSERIGEYVNPLSEAAWQAWQASAALHRQEQAEKAEWLPIDENYHVSRSGLVKDMKGRLLGQWKSNQGYMLVRLSSPRRMERVHRLVATAFIPNPRGLDTVNHIDCDRTNNNASNLEWCTQAENLHHSSNLGRMQRDYWVGKRSPNAGLTDEQVRLMRVEYASGGVSMQHIADRFGVSKRCVGRVINREVYSDVQ